MRYLSRTMTLGSVIVDYMLLHTSLLEEQFSNFSTYWFHFEVLLKLGWLNPFLEFLI